jgi:hypothetical protein
MKKIVLILILSTLAIFANAKGHNTPPQDLDTVCYHSTSATYQTINVPGNTYTWTVAAPGVITSGQGTNQITVNWGAANPGLISTAVTVFATNAAGCVSPPVLLDVFVLNIIPTIVPVTLCVNAPCVTLSGTPVGGTWSGVGVSGNQFCPSVAGTSNVLYTYSLSGCTFTANTTVTINPLPTISPITHD